MVIRGERNKNHPKPVHSLLKRQIGVTAVQPPTFSNSNRMSARNAAVVGSAPVGLTESDKVGYPVSH